jgi:AraC-like DNA-binding protein
MTAFPLHWLLVGASLGLSVAIVAIVLRDRDLSPTLRHVLAGLAIAGAAYGLILPAEGWLWDDLPRVALMTVAAPGVVLLWIAIRLLFDDRFKWGPSTWALLVVTALLPLMALAWRDPTSPGPRIPVLAVSIIASALVVHVLWLLFAGRRDDLDPFRRRLRLLLGGAGSAYVAIVLSLRVIPGAREQAVLWAPLLIGAQIGLKLLWIVLTSGHPSPLGQLSRSVATRQPSAADEALPAVDTHEDEASAPGDEAIRREPAAARILAAMEHERLYRRTGLTIRAFAQGLGLPEHRVRELINEHLAFRNFNAFLNYFRLREVAGRLRSPTDGHLPVLTLALDAGYGSIGPFNRAFREAYGVTPTEYRRASGVAPTAEPRISVPISKSASSFE